MGRPTRRGLIRGTMSAGAALAGGPLRAAAQTNADRSPQPFPLRQVRLRPSIFLTAVEANKRYLLFLQPDRLLHNFRKGAGLAPKGEPYGGWEARGIAGHSLGHYLSAVSLMYAQTGETAFRDRAVYILQELRTIQQAQGDGYAGGTTVDRDGQTLDGKVVYEELRRGQIRTSGFDLNGGWVPLYAYHKVFAGALDAHLHVEHPAALQVAQGLGDYLGRILEGLSDDQVQEILRAEHGGLTECYAELYAQLGERRWLTLAERLRHRSIIDPLAAGRDELAGKHANTQIPKVIGSARLYELTQDAQHAKAAMFFWEAVTKDHSYVIGGNSDHEHFGEPRKLSGQLGEQTCEGCNTYNMLRLTRRLYGWSGQGAYFDFYERAHLNHTMSQQDPESGMFTYFTPLAAGLRRVHSDPENDFWCCVGTGMESHAKHGESIWWKQALPGGGQRIIVNLYYASRLDAGPVKLCMDTAYPYGETVTITVEAQSAGAPGRRGPEGMELALRVPGWCADPRLMLNGKAAGRRVDGYFVLAGLRTGDRVELTLPMRTRVETMPDDARLLAFLSGPLVLAADLGPAYDPWEGYDPAVVAEDAVDLLTPALETPHVYALGEHARPQPLTLRPFFGQHHNRTAVYFRRFRQAEWEVAEAEFRHAAEARAEIRARTIDVIRLGEQQPEADHGFEGGPETAEVSHVSERGRRLLGPVAFNLRATDAPLALQVSYGRDRNLNFRILVDGQLLVRERLSDAPDPKPLVKTYPLPAPLTKGKSTIRVRFEADAPQWAMVYEARTVRMDPS